MKFTTVVLALSLVGAAWSDYPDEIIQKKAPWLMVPQPEVVDREKFPWQVAVIAEDTFFCAGTLVAQKWVLTAAHCVSNYHVFDLVIGSKQDVRQTTRDVKIHPFYRPNSQEFDVALLKLPEEVPLSRTVDIVRLPTPYSFGMNIEGIDLSMTGWASLEDKLSIWAGVSPPPLKSIRIRGAPDSACRATYGDGYSTNKICLDTISSPNDEGGLALVDGGSPIFFSDLDGNYTQVGVLSFGPGQSTLRPPVVATKIVSVLPWIKMITGMSQNGNKE